MFLTPKASKHVDSEAVEAYEKALETLENIRSRSPETQQLKEDISQFQRTDYFRSHVKSVISRHA